MGYTSIESLLRQSMQMAELLELEATLISLLLAAYGEEGIDVEYIDDEEDLEHNSEEEGE